MIAKQSGKNLYFLILMLLLWLPFHLSAWQESSDNPRPDRKKVLVLPLSDDGRFMVDQVQADFILESLENVESQGYSRVILKVDTFGGVVYSAREITERLLRLKIPTTAYVETKAISAGAFISWACDEIVMERSTTLGDAQMIFQTVEGIEEAPEKAITVYRSDWRKSSHLKKRPFAIARGFFEASTEVLQVGTPENFDFITREDYEAIDEAERQPIIKVIAREGELLTLFAEEAEHLGLVKVHDSFENYLEAADLSDAMLIERDMSTNQRVLRFIGANPWLFFLLTLIGLNGLYMELKAPGFGIPGLTAIVCFTIVFGSRYFLGTASGLEMALFVLGLALCAAEIFVLPGFGISGISGMVLMFGALIMASFPDFGEIPTHDIQLDYLRHLTSIMLSSFAFSIITAVLLVPLVFKLPVSQRLMLKKELRAEDGYVMKTVSDEAQLIGSEGTAQGDLRPAGKMRLPNGKILDVTSDGMYIKTGEIIQICRIEGNRIVVRPGVHS